MGSLPQVHGNCFDLDPETSIRFDRIYVRASSQHPPARLGTPRHASARLGTPRHASTRVTVDHLSPRSYLPSCDACWQVGAGATQRTAALLFRLLEVGGVCVGPFAAEPDSQCILQIRRVDESKFEVTPVMNVQFTVCDSRQSPTH